MTLWPGPELYNMTATVLSRLTNPLLPHHLMLIIFPNLDKNCPTPHPSEVERLTMQWIPPTAAVTLQLLQFLVSAAVDATLQSNIHKPQLLLQLSYIDAGHKLISESDNIKIVGHINYRYSEGVMVKIKLSLVYNQLYILTYNAVFRKR